MVQTIFRAMSRTIEGGPRIRDLCEQLHRVVKLTKLTCDLMGTRVGRFAPSPKWEIFPAYYEFFVSWEIIIKIPSKKDNISIGVISSLGDICSEFCGYAVECLFREFMTMNCIHNYSTSRSADDDFNSITLHENLLSEGKCLHPLGNQNEHSASGQRGLSIISIGWVVLNLEGLQKASESVSDLSRGTMALYNACKRLLVKKPMKICFLLPIELRRERCASIPPNGNTPTEVAKHCTTPKVGRVLRLKRDHEGEQGRETLCPLWIC